MTIDTEALRELIRQACPLPWTLATSNSWRRIVDPYHVPVVSPCNQADGHPDLAFPGGIEGPTARLLIEGVNAVPGLLDHIDAQAAQVTRWQRVAESAEARAQAAADEIDRLRSVLDTQSATIQNHERQFAALRQQVLDLRADRDQLRKALARVAWSFPRDTDMIAAGWEPLEIEEACNAFDAARAALQGESPCA
ncbi:MAG: hypothetical protein WC284_16420 [Candidimonas sp.]